MMRSRVRMFLRHTWLVAVLGTIMLGAAISAVFYYTAQADHMRIAAGPLDAKFVQALSNQLAQQHRNFHLQLVPTAGANDTAEAMSKNRADLAILPSPLDKPARLAGGRHSAAERDGADRPLTRRRD